MLQGSLRDLKHHKADKAAANTRLERQHNSIYYKICPVVAVVIPNITTTRKCSVNTVCQFQELSNTFLNVLLLFRMSLHHHFSATKLSSPAVPSSSRGSSTLGGVFNTSLNALNLKHPLNAAAAEFSCHIANKCRSITDTLTLR